MDTTITLVNDTTSVSLHCEADGATSYYWEKQSGVFLSSVTGVSTNSITFVNITLQDAGSYRCVANNASGRSASDYVHLDIRG